MAVVVDSQHEWDMTDTIQRGTLTDDILVLDMTAEMFVIGCTVDWVNEFGGSYLKVVNPKCYCTMWLWRKFCSLKKS